MVIALIPRTLNFSANCNNDMSLQVSDVQTALTDTVKVTGNYKNKNQRLNLKILELHTRFKAIKTKQTEIRRK